MTENQETKQAQTSASPRKWTVGTLTYTTGGLIALFCWLLWGDFAWSMKDRAVPPILQILLKAFGASDLTTGILLSSIPAFIGLIFSPIISYKSDRHRGRWGRRIPFLLLMTPVTVVGMLGLAFSPQIGASLHRLFGSVGENAWVIVALGLSWGAFEFGSITATGLFGGLVNDVVPRRVIGRFYGLFRALGLIAGILFNYYLLKHARTAYVEIFAGFGLLYGVGFGLMCLRVKEGEYPPEAPAAARHGAVAATRGYFRDCFGNAYYVLFFIAMALAALAFGPVNLFSIFYAAAVGMGTEAYGKCLALTYIISLVLAYPLGALADRFHPLRMGMVMMGIYGVVALCSGAFAHTPGLYGAALVAHGVISGTYFTVTASLGQRLLPSARFAELASAGGIIGSLLGILQGPSVGWLLDYTSHNYSYTFYAGSVVAFVSLALLIALHSKFMALGGPEHYVAPE